MTTVVLTVARAILVVRTARRSRDTDPTRMPLDGLIRRETTSTIRTVISRPTYRRFPTRAPAVRTGPRVDLHHGYGYA